MIVKTPIGSNIYILERITSEQNLEPINVFNEKSDLKKINPVKIGYAKIKA